MSLRVYSEYVSESDEAISIRRLPQSMYTDTEALEVLKLVKLII